MNNYLSYNKRWFFLANLFLIGCGVVVESPKKSPPLGLITTPATYYSTPKARYLGEKYKENLDRLVERIVRNPKTANLQFANNIASVGGIGFFTHSAVKSPDDRYLEVVVAAPETIETAADFNNKLQRLFSHYGNELLAVLASDSEIYQEQEVSGYGLNLSWRKITNAPRAPRVEAERAVVYLPKQRVRAFLRKEVSQNELLGEAVIFSLTEDSQMSLVSYRSPDPKPDFRPAILEETLPVAKSEPEEHLQSESEVTVAQAGAEARMARSQVEKTEMNSAKTPLPFEEKAQLVAPITTPDTPDQASAVARSPAEHAHEDAASAPLRVAASAEKTPPEAQMTRKEDVAERASGEDKPAVGARPQGPEVKLAGEEKGRENTESSAVVELRSPTTEPIIETQSQPPKETAPPEAGAIQKEAAPEVDHGSTQVAVVTVTEEKKMDPEGEALAKPIAAIDAGIQTDQKSDAVAVPLQPERPSAETKHASATVPGGGDKPPQKPAATEVALLAKKPTDVTAEKKSIIRSAPKPLEGYVIQVVFNERVKAQRWAETMEHRGYAVSVTEAGGADSVRVRIGNFALREEAERQMRALRQDGLEGIVINLPQAYRPEVRSSAPQEDQNQASTGR